MSKPDNNWEVHWQETLDKYEAGPPSTTDWGGMEQLLDATVVPVTPNQPATTGPFLKLSMLPWPVWAIALVSLLAMAYWLGSLTTGVIGQKAQPLPTEQLSASTTNTDPASNTVDETLSPPATISNRTAENLLTETNKSTFSPKPSPAINTPIPAGGPLNDVPPAALEGRVEGEPTAMASTPTSVEGTDSISQQEATNFFFPSYSPTKKKRANKKYRRIRPLQTYSLPTDNELWKNRIEDLLLQSNKIIVIPPTKVNNGHFPAYRLRN